MMAFIGYFEKIHWAFALFKLPVLLQSSLCRPKVSTVYNSMASLFCLMHCFDLSNMFLEEEAECSSPKTVWKNFHCFLHKHKKLKEMQLQKSKLMTEKSCFAFVPEHNIKIIINRDQEDASVVVLIARGTHTQQSHPTDL